MAAPGKFVTAEPLSATTFPAGVNDLVRIARSAITGELRSRHGDDVAWEQLIRLAELHGLEAFLFQAVRAEGAGIPSPVLRELSQKVSQIAARNLVLGRESVRVSRHLRSAGIDHLVYKGPLLAQLLYGTAATRPSRDIDLIVRPEQAEQAFGALATLGYLDKDSLDGPQRSAAIRFASEQCFARDGIEVDLHWRIAPQASARSFDALRMWQRAINVRFFDSDVPTLKAEDLFVALCLHAGEHGWSQLSLFCDLGRLIKVTPEFDWEIVRSHTSDANTRRTVDVTLLLLANCFGLEIPPDLLRREMQVELIAARVVAEFWPDPERSAHKETDLQWIRQRCRGERFGDRFRWIYKAVLTPTMADFQSLRLPHSLQFLYPALRVLRLGLRGRKRQASIG